jgi:hypothetical protein
MKLNKETREKIFESIGSASMCWEHVDKAGVFDSTTACTIGEDLCSFIADEIEKAQRRIIEMDKM